MIAVIGNFWLWNADFMPWYYNLHLISILYIKLTGVVVIMIMTFRDITMLWYWKKCKCKNKVLIIKLLDKCLRGNKIAPLQHAWLTSLSMCAKGVQFYCPSCTYPAIPYCTISPFLAHSASTMRIWLNSTTFDVSRPVSFCPRLGSVLCHFWKQNDAMKELSFVQIIILFC